MARTQQEPDYYTHSGATCLHCTDSGAFSKGQARLLVTHPGVRYKPHSPRVGSCSSQSLCFTNQLKPHWVCKGREKAPKSSSSPHKAHHAQVLDLDLTQLDLGNSSQDRGEPGKSATHPWCQTKSRPARELCVNVQHLGLSCLKFFTCKQHKCHINIFPLKFR